MLLAIDIGNTNSVFALFTGQSLTPVSVWRAHTQATRTADEYGALFGAWMARHGGDGTISDCLISSVVPGADFNIDGFVRKYLGLTPRFATHDTVPIQTLLERPEEAGADRLINAYAVRALYQNPAIVLDFGTATTFDVVTPEGAYAGGVIAPGVHLSLEALNRAAAKLPRVAVARPQRAIGRSTIQAMQSGIYLGYTGMIKGIIDQIAAELGAAKPFVIATGGLARLYAEKSDIIDVIDDDLTLKGLCLMVHPHLSDKH